jgi:hypothetical protein
MDIGSSLLYGKNVSVENGRWLKYRISIIEKQEAWKLRTEQGIGIRVVLPGSSFLFIRSKSMMCSPKS